MQHMTAAYTRLRDGSGVVDVNVTTPESRVTVFSSLVAQDQGILDVLRDAGFRPTQCADYVNLPSGWLRSVELGTPVAGVNQAALESWLEAGTEER